MDKHPKREIRKIPEMFEIETSGLFVGGKLYSRIADRNNENSPEHLLAGLAEKAGYRRGEQVSYELIISKKY